MRGKRFADHSKDNPDVNCMPLGILQMNTHPFPRRLIQAPGYIAILHERDMEYRQIFTDGRPLPKDPQPAWNGYSTGKWAGDTLVVETTGFLALQVDSDLLEYVCLEGEKDAAHMVGK
jgi:hypothetical protein